MRDHDYSEVLLGVQGSQDTEDFSSRRAVQIAGRFVGQQHLGLHDQGAGDGGALHFAPRKFARPVAQPVSEADQAQEVLGLLRVPPAMAK